MTWTAEIPEQSVKKRRRGHLLADDLGTLDHAVVIKWLIINGVAIFGLTAAWHFGLIQAMVQSDKSYISLGITLLYVVGTAHCALRTFYVSRELNLARRVAQPIEEGSGFRLIDERVLDANGNELTACQLSLYIRDLIVKSRAAPGKRLDQTLMLQSLHEFLRAKHQLGWFLADAMFKLGLLGTVIGFIMMLTPIGGLTSFDVGSLKGALTSMSGGMAVALYTTLAGLLGGMLLRLQYYVLDDATDELVALTTRLTEVHVVPVLEGRAGAP